MRKIWEERVQTYIYGYCARALFLKDNNIRCPHKGYVCHCVPHAKRHHVWQNFYKIYASYAQIVQHFTTNFERLLPKQFAGVNCWLPAPCDFRPSTIWSVLFSLLRQSFFTCFFLSFRPSKGSENVKKTVFASSKYLYRVMFFTPKGLATFLPVVLSYRSARVIDYN